MLVSQLWDATRNSDAMDKVASLNQDFLRDRLREISVADRVLPPVVLTEAELERNTTNDWPLKRVDIEPDSKAMSLGFRGKGEAKFFDGKRFEVYFTKIESEHFKKTREELMTMRYPVVDVVEQNFVLDMHEQLDKLFQARLTAAAAASGNTASVSGGLLTKDAIIALKKKILAKRRRPTTLIMTEARYNDLALLTADKLGFELVQNVSLNGVEAIQKFLNLNIVTSINTADAGSVWPENKVYLVTEPQRLGASYVIGDVQQEMKREGNSLEWYTWMDRGLEIGNINSVAELTINA